MTLLLALPSGILWIVNAEALVVVQVTQTDALPWLVAPVTTVGQFIGYSVLFFFASGLLSRVAFIRRATRKVNVAEPGWPTFGMSTSGGLCGVPPLLALFTVYGSARAPGFAKLLAFALPARLVWYLAWAYGFEWDLDKTDDRLSP